MIKWLTSFFTPAPKFMVGPCGRLPTRGSKEAAGLDLYAAHGLTIRPGETKLVQLGITCEFNPGWVALLWDRSGIGFKGRHRYAGVIDSDYRGEWGCVIHNASVTDMTIDKGDRVCQVLFQRVWTGVPGVSEKLSETSRSSGGFGSTGK